MREDRYVQQEQGQASAASPRRSARPLVGALMLLAAVVVVRFVFGDQVSRFPVDLDVYRAGADAVRHGDPLYAMRMPTNGLAFTYPVFAALIFVPLSLVPFGVAKVGLSAISLFALVVICVCAVRMAKPRPCRHAVPLGLALAGFALFSEPVTLTFRLGQINLIVVALILLDLTALRDSRWQGVLIGVATGIKLSPGLFIVYLLLIGRLRASVTGVAAFATTVALGLVAQPGQAWAFWTHHMLDPNRVGGVSYVSNQSVLGVVSRLLADDHPARLLTLGIGAVIVAAALWTARLAHRRGEDLLAVNAVALGGLIASPISWAHHWVWFIPALVGLAAMVDPEGLRAGDRRARLAAASALAWAGLFWIGPMWYVPREPVRYGIDLTPWQNLLAASFFLAGCCYLAWAVFRASGPGSVTKHPATSAPTSLPHRA
jgi:alpha-1,2-mannosyltransferase